MMTAKSFFALQKQKYQKIREIENAWNIATESAFIELINGDYNPNETNDERETILSHIARIGRLDFVKMLVEAGADVNIVGFDEITFPLCEAALNYHQKVYDYLVTLTKPELIDLTQQAVAEALVYRKRLKSCNEQVENLIDAVDEGNLEDVINHIGNGVDVNAIGFHYSNALHRACFYGHIPIINTLLSAGADPDIKEARRGKTPLMITLDTIYYLSQNIDGTNAQIEIAKILLEAGVDLNAKDNCGDSALVYAITKTKKGIISSILIEAGADVNSQNDDDLTALMISCGGWAIPKKCVEILLKAGANTELKDNQGNTALTYAIREPKYLEKKTLQLEKVKLLAEAGADLNTQDNNGNTALNIAKEVGNTEIVKLLIKAGAKKN